MFIPNWSNLQLIGSAITFIQVNIYRLCEVQVGLSGWLGVFEVFWVVSEPGDLEEWGQLWASWRMVYGGTRVLGIMSLV